MSSKAKKYIITAVTLGAIAMVSGLLIGATNLVTKDSIAKNEVKKINNGIATIYSDYENVHFSSEEDVEKSKQNSYVNHVYYIYDGTSENEEENTFIGWALRTEGSNNYGKISLIIGFNQDRVFKNLSVVKNEQSFASTLNKKYLDPLMTTDDKETQLDDVSCGATFGAKLVRDMVNNAKEVVQQMNKE